MQKNSLSSKSTSPKNEYEIDVNKKNAKYRIQSLLNIPLKKILGITGIYDSKLKILSRPDTFRLDTYRSHDINSEIYLQGLKNHIYKTRLYRSAGLKIDFSKIKTDSLLSFAKSYIEEIERIEKKYNYKVILLSTTWGEYGIFTKLGLETIYLVRDPFNSLISYSKPIRHERNFYYMGLTDINSKEWIDAYLEGPLHYWISHAQNSFQNKKGIIVRYNYFKDDWETKVHNLPNISIIFNYRENNVSGILTPDSIKYIRSKTENICTKLQLPIY
jgi:hypothetical protein